MQLLRRIIAKRRPRAGFTLIELLIVVAITAIIGIVVFVSFGGSHGVPDLGNTTGQIASLLRQAQSQSVADYEGVPWGIHFVNATTSFYALFSTAYATATMANRYNLPTTVAFQTSTLPVGSSLDVIFSALSGASSVSTSIRLYLIAQPAQSSTVHVASSGEVSF